MTEEYGAAPDSVAEDQDVTVPDYTVDAAALDSGEGGNPSEPGANLGEDAPLPDAADDTAAADSADDYEEPDYEAGTVPADEAEPLEGADAEALDSGSGGNPAPETDVVVPAERGPGDSYFERRQRLRAEGWTSEEVNELERSLGGDAFKRGE